LSDLKRLVQPVTPRRPGAGHSVDRPQSAQS
jgi:hypothetical protein